MTTTIDLRGLRYLSDPDDIATVERTMGPNPPAVLTGVIGAVRFIVALDGAGDCAISLTGLDGPLKRGDVRRFWRLPGGTPPRNSVPICDGRGLLWAFKAKVERLQ